MNGLSESGSISLNALGLLEQSRRLRRASQALGLLPGIEAWLCRMTMLSRLASTLGNACRARLRTKGKRNQYCQIALNGCQWHDQEHLIWQVRCTYHEEKEQQSRLWVCIMHAS